MLSQLITLINDLMRGQLTYHEAIQQKHREVRFFTESAHVGALCYVDISLI